ncbi:MAG: PilZ domain-containing protein [Clostridia bacterium]|nr:PilZ domain-containing protein [Deltaproteobacteria bacterium]
MMNDAKAAQNQRRDPRRALMLRVDLTHSAAPNDADVLSSAWTADVSAGGMSLRGTKDLTMGQIVRMRVSFPGLLEPMDVLGNVVWSQKSLAITGGVGVRVCSAIDRQRLAHLAELAELPSLRRTKLYRIVLMEADPLAALTHRIGLDALHPITTSQLSVQIARDWQSARSIIESALPDLLMLGLHPRSPDSAAALAYIETNTTLAQSMVVALANADDAVMARQAALIADATFRKPVPVARVVDTIGYLLNRRVSKHACIAYV